MLILQSSKRKIVSVLLFTMLFATFFSCAKQSGGCTSPAEAVKKYLYALDERNAKDLASVLAPNFTEAYAEGKPEEILSVIQELFDQKIDMDIIELEIIGEHPVEQPYNQERYKGTWGYGVDDDVTELVVVSYEITIKEKWPDEETTNTGSAEMFCGKIGEHWYIVAID